MPMPSLRRTTSPAACRCWRETEAANVGGVWDIRPGGEGWVARSIAAAVAHRLGAGDAGYRAGARAGEVDTVPFGAFDRRWLERVGAFNEELLTNEDYEYNYRLRQAGGMIWLDPSIRCVYFARPTLSALARQYWRYGFWKAHMLTRYPRSLRCAASDSACLRRRAARAARRRALLAGRRGRIRSPGEHLSRRPVRRGAFAVRSRTRYKSGDRVARRLGYRALVLGDGFPGWSGFSPDDSKETCVTQVRAAAGGSNRARDWRS